MPVIKQYLSHKTIYLTFDDGIQDGTEEVLNVLEETGIKATFFLVGNHVLFFLRKNRQKLMRILNEVYLKHSIGNHSFSHASVKSSIL